MKTAVMKRRVKGICATSSRGRKTDGGTRNIASSIIQRLSQQSHYCRQLTISFYPQELGNCCQLEHNTYSDHSFDLFAVTGWVKSRVADLLTHRALTSLCCFAFFSQNAYNELVIRGHIDLFAATFLGVTVLISVVSCRGNI